MSIPSLVLAILIIAVIGPNLTNTIVAVDGRRRAVLRAPGARFGAHRTAKDYVTGAKVAGNGPWRLMLVTVLPNCLAPLIVQAALGVSDAILGPPDLDFSALAPSRRPPNGARCWPIPRI